MSLLTSWFEFSLVQNWSKTSLLSKLKDLADRRKLADLTVGPVLTVSITCLLFPPFSNWSDLTFKIALVACLKFVANLLLKITKVQPAL